MHTKSTLSDYKNKTIYSKTHVKQSIKLPLIAGLIESLVPIRLVHIGCVEQKVYFCSLSLQLVTIMAKSGRPKNTKNKAKHAKLVDRKKNKLRQKQDERTERLKALKEKIKEHNQDSTTND